MTSSEYTPKLQSRSHLPTEDLFLDVLCLKTSWTFQDDLT